ncbi:MAG: response regulator [Planctomycetes bacterium]|nr:response regulator [Planctomycetota bacterium]
MPKPSILLVEDNPDEAQLLREALTGIDPDIPLQVATTISDAWSLVSGLTDDQLPALIITDHHLPDAGGQELIDLLRACPTRCHVPVVMLSGDLQRPPGIGESAWFTKPDTWAGWRALAHVLMKRLAAP